MSTSKKSKNVTGKKLLKSESKAIVGGRSLKDVKSGNAKVKLQSRTGIA